ncbi:NAD(P)-binding protein [Mycena belliarum]|uniref:NAD(P)-binding protein n=1 Tax=Mycena belliarum TaxID=1033014 RepID=A0AAD6XMD3_9AGAR|nr:NAD(P)-binding protein [Mycena belliae]
MGTILARLSPPKFKPARDIEDLSGKVVLVTGGNAGIGYETVKQLLLKNAKVYVAARSPEKAHDAIKRLEQETKKTAIFLQLDLADLTSVRKAAETFLAQESKLDILINNAGVMVPPREQLTAQNYDLQFGTNVVGHFLFTELLIPALTKSHEETKLPARVVNVSSMGHRLAPGDGIELATLKGGPERDAWLKKKADLSGRWTLYGQSKLGNILVSNYLARKYSDVLVSCAIHPGFIRTDLFQYGNLFERLGGTLGYPTPLGAYTQLWAATYATPTEITGQWVMPFGKVQPSWLDKRGRSVALEEKLIAYLKEQVANF